jgi:lysophospholipase L1-like esterase
MDNPDNEPMNLKRIVLLSWLCCLVMAAPWPAFAAETKHNYAQWDREIGAFVASDRTNPPPQHALLFIGSSTIRKWTTLAEDFPGQPVINRGFGGSEIVDSTHFARQIVFPYAPRMIFFRAGGNDLWAGKTPAQVFEDFEAFVAEVHARLPGTEIFFISWGPTPSRWKQHEKEIALNFMAKEYAAKTPHVQYIETYDMVLGSDGKPRPELFQSDMLHYNAAGYKLLADRVRPYLPK